MNSQNDQLEQLITQLYKQAKLRTPAEFQEWAMDEAARILEFDSGMWIDGIPPLDFVSLYLYKQPQEMIENYTRVLEEYGVEDILAVKAVEKLGNAVIRTEEIGPDEFDPVFEYHCKKYGILQGITLGFERPGVKLFTYISWYRDDITRPFPPGYKAIKEMLDPHMREAYEICLLLHVQKEIGITDDLNHRAYAICNTSGGVIYCNDRFIVEARLEDSIVKGFQIAPQIWQKLQQAREAVVGNDTMQLFEIANSQYLVEIRTEQSPLAALTDREHEIACKLALGESYKKIAQALDRSPSTIQNQAANIYRKLNIAGKHELSTLLQTVEKTLPE